MKKSYKILIASFPSIFAILYSSGYVSQFLYNFQSWQATGGQAGDGTSPVLPSPNFFECLKAAFHMPYGFQGFIFCVVVIAIFAFMVMRMGHGEGGAKDTERNLTYSDTGTYGTAEFLSQKDASKVLDFDDVKHNKGTILGRTDGKTVFVPTNTRMNRNIAVFGASGSMKSRAFCRNAILQAARRGNDKDECCESMVITDPKSELYEDTAEFLKERGYTVRVFNTVNPENSDSWDCLAEIEKNEIMAQIFSDVIIKDTGSDRGDHFWDNSELNLLKALTLYVSFEYPNGSMSDVYKLISLDGDAESALNKMFAMLPPGHPAKAPYNIFRQAADSVRGGIIIGLGSRLQVFQNKLICDITSHREIDLELPGKEKCAYFVITSDQDSTFDFLSSLFFSFLFIKLVRYADKHCEGGKLPVFVNVIADEFTNIRVADIQKKISTIRSRNIGLSCIFQNLAQLQNRYPMNAWQEILGNCDVQLFLGATDEITAKYVSDRTGVASVKVDSKAKMLNTWRVSNYSPQYRETVSVGKRNILTPDEVLRIPLDEALIILRGQNVMKVKKFDYTNHPDSRYLVKSKASLYVPKWAEDRCETPLPVTLSRQEDKSTKGGDVDVTPKVKKTAVSTNRQALMSENTGK